MSRFRTLLPALAVLLAPAASAQVLLAPGHPDLVTEGVSVGDVLSLVRVAEPTAEDVGTTSARVTQGAGTVTVVTTADASDVGLAGTSAAATFAWPSLRPVETVDGAQGRVTYDGVHMTGLFGRGDREPLPYDITLDAEPFQPEAVPFLARMLPLRRGYTATVPTFSAQSQLRTVTLAVAGPEPFVGADGAARTA